LIFMSSAFARLLEVKKKQIVLTKITVFNAIINIILNILLIPKYSYIAASFVTVLTELSSLLLLIKVVSSMGYELSRKELSAIFKVIIASSVMAIFILLLINWNLYLLILASIIIYMVTLFLIKGLDEDDIKIIRSILGK
ncbi:MAG: polysaccharide biosynthesis C-terminal domain-containing protein, partial [Methanobacterium sp.]